MPAGSDADVIAESFLFLAPLGITRPIRQQWYIYCKRGQNGHARLDSGVNPGTNSGILANNFPGSLVAADFLLYNR